MSVAVESWMVEEYSKLVFSHEEDFWFVLKHAGGSKVGDGMKRGEGGGRLLQCGEEGVEKVRVWSSVRGNVEGACPIALL